MSKTVWDSTSGHTTVNKKGPPGPPSAEVTDNNGKPKMSKPKRIRARNTTKVRVKLPPIESYQKELEFPADGPGRVVVRLERLMGSDRVRITDTKYMATLLERLEEQERISWAKRREGRIKTERNRFRQLAIDGLMEPGPDMQDLYYHPVFRVNRILNRLAKMDHNITSTPNNKLPPITPIDPFEFDNNGREFINYPGHVNLRQGDLSELGSRADVYAELMGTKIPPSSQGSMASKASKVSTKFKVEYEEEADDFEDDRPDKLPKLTSNSQKSMQSSKSAAHLHRTRSIHPNEVASESLTEMQQKYGVIPVRDLTSEWEPFRSHLVDMVFLQEEAKIQEFYSLAEEVLGVYSRKQATTDDFVIKLNKML